MDTDDVYFGDFSGEIFFDNESNGEKTRRTMQLFGLFFGAVRWYSMRPRMQYLSFGWFRRLVRRTRVQSIVQCPLIVYNDIERMMSAVREGASRVNLGQKFVGRGQRSGAGAAFGKLG